MTTRMPDHVVRHLIAQGHLDTDSVGRRARLRTCHDCGHLVVTGLDHDRTALRATVDLAPLNPAGELTALLAGRRTYVLGFTGSAYCIDIRWPESIAAKPAGTFPNCDVVAEHKCHARQLGTTESRIESVMTRSEADQCPF